MSGHRLVVFDVETGGLDPARHPIIQFAAVAVDVAADWKELEALELKLLFDENAAEKQALEVNHYDPDVWRREGVLQPLAYRRISDFLRRHATLRKVSAKSGKPYEVARLCGHNGRFDGDFLAATFKRAGLFLPAACFEVLDTLALARWVSMVSPPGPTDHKLGSLCAWMGIELLDAHDALADVRATCELARRLLGLVSPLAAPNAPVEAFAAGMERRA